MSMVMSSFRRILPEPVLERHEIGVNLSQGIHIGRWISGIIEDWQNQHCLTTRPGAELTYTSSSP
jgi:hypothetical protein